MTDSIKPLIDALKEAKNPSFEDLERILHENLPAKEVILNAAEAVMPYGRTLLYLDDDVEIIIGCWPRNGWCDTHDHGDGIGIVHSYSGEIEHLEYRLSDGFLDLEEQCTMKEGETSRLPFQMIHALQNVNSDEPYVGLHIYVPPAKDVRVFDLKSGNIYHVTDDYYSCVPKEEKYIRKKEEKVFVYRNLVKIREKEAV